MNRKIYVVFPDSDADPVAAFTVRKDAEKACGILEVKYRVEYWIADIAVMESFEEFMETKL